MLALALMVPRKAPNTKLIFHIPESRILMYVYITRSRSEICPAATDSLIDDNNSLRKAFAQIKT